MNKKSLPIDANIALLAPLEHEAQPRKLAQIKRWSSKELFSGARELLIEHGGDEYRLRLTNQGKLILTK